jgi:hypothetical protein
MRRYSLTERVLFALLGGLVFLPTALLTTYILVTMPDARRDGLWWGVAGAWAGLFVCVKIVLTAHSTRFLERAAFGQRRAQEDSANDSPTS